MHAFNDSQAILDATHLVDWFLEFVQIDTQSDNKSETTPSSAKQLDLQRVLEKKLADVGCTEIHLDDKGYLYATFPGNKPDAPVIGLLAHVDTATDFSGTGVKPQLHENYDGGEIAIADGLMLTPQENAELSQCVGDTIVTASGDTLLGADDKAGIAVILAALETLKADESIPCPTLRIAFTPDEEIGRGAKHFDIKGFNAYCAYTLDGSFAGEINFETFSADGAEVTFTGVAVHPGFAKGKMVNALRYLGKFLDQLPSDEAPEATEGREGFFHPTEIRGNAAEATVELILRSFDNDELEDRGKRLRELVDRIAAEEPRLKTQVDIKFQYRNMADELKKHPQIREHLLAALRDAGVEANVVPVRGGTDGSGLTAMGLPTPNIFNGGVNFHGPREWVSTRVMAVSVCAVLNLVQRWAAAE
ncbi:MAG: peptidase T [Candidatus Lernaella stagnicola]|nr:peptidase T [Candidatus Lernaella stagnicola]